MKNYSDKKERIQVVNKFSNANGGQIFRLVDEVELAAGETKIVEQQAIVENAELWSPERPYLYTLATMIKRDEGKRTTDEVTTPYGIRTFSWPVFRNDGDQRFYVNGQPTYINGVCEYEHQFGQSHAFSHEQVAARVKQMRAAGFNAFRDAHQPHHLDYQGYWDKYGVLFWTQLSAHIWYDTPEFRTNFKTMLRRWVKERRNCPSVMMWGLQNESVLPRDFAEECVAIIREMDPTSATMRPVTTCNGGVGTDWNVVQNWSGTYGGDLFAYGEELSRPEQLLNGEYGAWRTTGFHCEPQPFDPAGAWTEDRMTQLMETKVRLAEQYKDRLCGQFQWVYSSHDNPGRRQPEESYRRIDKVGPFNNKGLVTPWEEPNDVYYMYRANYISPRKEPMVYLVSHTWADRFASGERRATIEAYSNCDSVLLYNDAVDNAKCFLGRKRQHGVGTHFMWEHRLIKYNVLRAVAYYGGKAVAEDLLVLEGLREAPHFADLRANDGSIVKGAEGYRYLYRVNCGGDSYTDSYGNVWDTDDVRYSRSWSADFEGLSPYLASQRTTYDPIGGTRDWKLFQSFRFGRHKLNYRFALPDGRYRVELYFVEPWHGTGGGLGTDCEGLRLFDVAINGRTVIDDLDIWAEKGHDEALKRVVEVDVVGGELKIDFPEVKAGQALISAIAIATTNPEVQVAAMPASDWSWAAAERDVVAKTPKEELPEEPDTRPTVTYEAEQAKIVGRHHTELLRKREGVFFEGGAGSIEWTVQTGLAQVYAFRFKFVNETGRQVPLRLQLIAPNGVTLRDQEVMLPDLGEKWRVLSTTSGSYINAGEYRVILSGEDLTGLAFESLDVQ